MAQTAIQYLFLGDLYFPLVPWQISLYKTRFDWATRSSKPNAPNLSCFLHLKKNGIHFEGMRHSSKRNQNQTEGTFSGGAEWGWAGWTIVIGPPRYPRGSHASLSALKAAKLTPRSITRQHDTPKNQRLSFVNSSVTVWDGHVWDPIAARQTHKYGW